MTTSTPSKSIDEKPSSNAEATAGRYDDVATTLIAMGVIGTIVLAVGTYLLPPLSRATALAWPGVEQAMQQPGKVLAVGCCVFLTLPFVRNAALFKCLAGVDASVRKSALVVMGLSTSIIALTLVWALL